VVLVDVDLTARLELIYMLTDCYWHGSQLESHLMQLWDQCSVSTGNRGLSFACFSAGGQDGVVRVFDLRDGTEVANYQAANDTVNGFEFHPYLPFAATASGVFNILVMLSSACI